MCEVCMCSPGVKMLHSVYQGTPPVVDLPGLVNGQKLKKSKKCANVRGIGRFIRKVTLAMHTHWFRAKTARK